MAAVARALRRITERDDVALIFPVHLNPNVRAVMNDMLGELPSVAMIEPLDYPHFVRPLEMAHIVLTDSGGVQEKAPALGKPVLAMRETTERPEGVEAGTARLVGADEDRIVAGVLELLDSESAYSAMARAHNPFGDGRSAAIIGTLIASRISSLTAESRSSAQPI
jgi:UDP-N-acetylglucosamine 2-epimerase (non-hydrolysing)